MRLSIIVALSENRVIGKGRDLPWHLSADLKRFKRLTMGHHLILGRKTFDSIGRPLPGRTMLVLTRSDLAAKAGLDGVEAVASLDQALEIAELSGDQQAFVAGGAEIYALALPAADRLYITRVEAEVQGDVYFPELDWDEWHLVARESHPADDKHVHSFRFETYDRVAGK